MVWNASEYGINDLRFPADYIWKPDVLLYNRWAGPVTPALTIWQCRLKFRLDIPHQFPRAL